MAERLEGRRRADPLDPRVIRRITLVNRLLLIYIITICHEIALYRNSLAKATPTASKIVPAGASLTDNLTDHRLHRPWAGVLTKAA
jgi:hypothetical protein